MLKINLNNLCIKLCVKLLKQALVTQRALVESHDFFPVEAALAVCSAADPHLAVPLSQAAVENPAVDQVQSAWERALV